MTRLTVAVVMAGIVALASTSNAQGAGGPPPGGMGRNGGPGAPGMQGMPGMQQGGPPPAPRGDAASMLLSHTGELKLTDAQVTRLAAIARKAAEHRTAMRATGDSLHNAMMKSHMSQPASPNNPPAPPQENPAMRALMEKTRQAQHENLRDALAVLTPEQQASAFEFAVRGGPRQRHAPGAGGRGMGGQGMDMGGMMGGRGMQGPPQDNQGPPPAAPRRRPPAQ